MTAGFTPYDWCDANCRKSKSTSHVASDRTDLLRVAYPRAILSLRGPKIEDGQNSNLIFLCALKQYTGLQDCKSAAVHYQNLIGSPSVLTSVEMACQSSLEIPSTCACSGHSFSWN